jgi:hypothetical protein
MPEVGGGGVLFNDTDNCSHIILVTDWWDDTERGKQKYILGEKPDPVVLRQPQIPHQTQAAVMTNW